MAFWSNAPCVNALVVSHPECRSPRTPRRFHQKTFLVMGDLKAGSIWYNSQLMQHSAFTASFKWAIREKIEKQIAPRSSAAAHWHISLQSLLWGKSWSVFLWSHEQHSQPPASVVLSRRFCLRCSALWCLCRAHTQGVSLGLMDLCRVLSQEDEKPSDEGGESLLPLQGGLGTAARSF